MLTNFPNQISWFCYIIFAYFEHNSGSVRLHITPKAELKIFISLKFWKGKFFKSQIFNPKCMEGRLAEVLLQVTAEIL